MDNRVSEFLTRVEQVLDRLQPWLPEPAAAIDWSSCLAARWQRDGRQAALRPLQVRLELRLADLLGVDRQRALLEANTRQFVAGLPANHALLRGARGTGWRRAAGAGREHLAGRATAVVGRRVASGPWFSVRQPPSRFSPPA